MPLGHVMRSRDVLQTTQEPGRANEEGGAAGAGLMRVRTCAGPGRRDGELYNYASSPRLVRSECGDVTFDDVASEYHAHWRCGL